MEVLYDYVLHTYTNRANVIFHLFNVHFSVLGIRYVIDIAYNGLSLRHALQKLFNLIRPIYVRTYSALITVCTAKFVLKKKMHNFGRAETKSMKYRRVKKKTKPAFCVQFSAVYCGSIARSGPWHLQYTSVAGSSSTVA